MFQKKVKADWRTPGYKESRKNGEIHARLYTPYPLRFQQAFFKTIVAFIIYMLVVVGVDEAITSAELGPVDDSLVEGLAITFGVLIYPIILFTDKEHVRFSKSHFTIRRQKFAFSAMGTFRTHDIGAESRGPYILKFDYGNKTKTINVPNAFDDQFLVMKAMNRAVAEMRSGAKASSKGPSRMTMRSAGF